MPELYFNSRSEIINHLESNLNFSEEDAEYFDDDLFDYEEVQDKRSTRCSGYFLDQNRNIYYFMSFLHDYDWGNSDYMLDTTTYKREEHEETLVIKKVKYTEIKE